MLLLSLCCRIRAIWKPLWRCTSLGQLLQVGVGTLFLDALRDRIEAAVKERDALKEFADDIQVRCQYDAQPDKSHLSLYRESWTQYP